MDPLELASQQAQQLTLTNIDTYRNSDPVGHAMKGFQFGLGAVQSIQDQQSKQALASEQIDTMRAQRATEESRVREAQQRMMLFDQTLGLQSKKAAVELQTLQSQLEGSRLRQQLDKQQASDTQQKAWSDLSEHAPWQDEKGQWWYMRYVPGSAPVPTQTTADSWIVDEYKKDREAKTGERQAHADYYRGRAGGDPSALNVSTGDARILTDLAKDLDSRATLLDFSNNADEKAKAADLHSQADALRRRIYTEPKSAEDNPTKALGDLLHRDLGNGQTETVGTPGPGEQALGALRISTAQSIASELGIEPQAVVGGLSTLARTLQSVNPEYRNLTTEEVVDRIMKTVRDPTADPQSRALVIDTLKRYSR